MDKEFEASDKDNKIRYTFSRRFADAEEWNDDGEGILIDNGDGEYALYYAEVKESSQANAVRGEDDNLRKILYKMLSDVFEKNPTAVVTFTAGKQYLTSTGVGKYLESVGFNVKCEFGSKDDRKCIMTISEKAFKESADWPSKIVSLEAEQEEKK